MENNNEKKEPTASDALAFLNSMLATVNANRQTHIDIQVAIQIIEKEIFKKEENYE